MWVEVMTKAGEIVTVHEPRELIPRPAQEKERSFPERDLLFPICRVVLIIPSPTLAPKSDEGSPACWVGVFASIKVSNKELIEKQMLATICNSVGKLGRAVMCQMPCAFTVPFGSQHSPSTQKGWDGERQKLSTWCVFHTFRTDQLCRDCSCERRLSPACHC